MSAYVVDDKTVNRILSFIEYGEAGVEGNGFLRNVLTRHHINVLAHVVGGPREIV